MATINETIQLRGCEYLTHSEASLLTAASPTSVVVIGGSARSGKTSLMAGVFSLLHKGPIGVHSFAGSRTLAGFEQRCHLATMNSGLEEPDMERTKVSSEERFLHTRLRTAGVPRLRQLLFCDLPGEVFRDAANNAEDCARLGVLHRADSFTLLVDGKKACDLRQRQSAFSMVENLLAQCLDQSMLDSSSFVQLVVSKWDLVQTAGPSSEEFAHNKLKRLEEMFKSRLGELCSFKIAVHAWARGGTDTHEDFVRLLEKWIRLRPLREKVSASVVQTTARNEFDRFGIVQETNR
jgi:hypothetical protein